MGASPVRPPRASRAGGSLPRPLLAVLITCVAAVLALSVTSLARGSSSAAAAGSRTLPRVLLQGAHGERRTGRPEAALYSGSGDSQAAAAQQQQQQQPGGLEPEDGMEEGAHADDSHGSYFGSLFGALVRTGAPVHRDSPVGTGNPAANEGSEDISSPVGTGEPRSSSLIAASSGQQVQQGGEEFLLPEVSLVPTSDLATFADPGTTCIITPVHGKVALLFLTEAVLPHDQTWTAWLREARGLLPRGSLAGPDAFCLKQCDASGACVQRCGRSAACNPLCVDALQRDLGPKRSPAVLQQQHLFSVYVHAKTTLKDYPEGSAFAGRLIPDRSWVKPGTHSVAAAVKRLVEAAVLDRRNEWFVLVDNTTVPLYHPAMVYQQLMSETQSRIDACRHPDAFLHHERSCSAMRTDRFNPAQHWRKSSQWFMLNRKHAELVAHDTELVSVFAQHCYVGVDAELGRRRDCYSEQHYIPSLLAMYGLDGETTCDATGGTYQQWLRGVGADDTATGRAGAAPEGAQQGGHFKVFQPGHITPELINSLRSTVGGPPDAPPSDESELCEGWAAAQAAAREAFVDAGATTQAACPATLGSLAYLQQAPYADAALDARCVLLGRQFSRHAAKWVHKVYRSCTGGLGVLSCSPRLTDRDNQWWS